MDYGMKLICNVLIALMAIAMGCSSTPSEKMVESDPPPLGYGKTYTLQNNSVKVVIAPDIGRVIHFGFVGERNLVWMKDRGDLAKNKASGAEWLNWGGDKVWPAQQAKWPLIYGGGDWPPKTKLDGYAFRVVESTAAKLVVESPVDQALHVRLRRTFCLDDDLPRLTIENTLTREASSSWPVHIWSVTQCVLPNYTLLGIAEDAPKRDSQPFLNLWDAPLPDSNAKLMTNALRLSLDENLHIAKAGTIGSWCAAVYDNEIFLQKSDALPNGRYPDGANVEVFMFDQYTELELLSSSVHLPKGKSISSATVWSLLKTEAKATTEENLKLIEGLNSAEGL